MAGPILDSIPYAERPRELARQEFCRRSDEMIEAWNEWLDMAPGAENIVNEYINALIKLCPEYRVWRNQDV